MIGKIIPAMLLSLFVAWAVGAADVELNPQHPTSYTVVRGDTLWDIAGRFLRYPWQWPDIWEANQQIENPHRIYPGDEVHLSYRDGRPILSLARSRSVKLSPSVREYQRDDAIPPIPLDAIHQFLSRPRVVTAYEIDHAAYVVGSQDEHLATGTGYKIYVRGIEDTSSNRFSIFRTGVEYRDPDTQALLGYEALHIADASVTKFDNVSTATITWSNREVIKGDRLFVQEAEEYPEFVPHAPTGAIDGRIISVVDGVSQIGQHNVVVINKGATDGITPGHVLAIFQTGEVVRDQLGTEQAAKRRLEDFRRAEAENTSSVGRFFDKVANDFRESKQAVDKALGEPIGGTPVTVELPEERAGELLVFRAFDAVSFGLVMNTQRPVHLHDKVRNP
ncbi:MAG: LysM peptidoglycan-binding domain-containing protein [Gammaproteobacteria bacterium]|nr:LysM peptidoglycan-binding domain-containing protein [Gammaproteobacteria bacterium]